MREFLSHRGVPFEERDIRDDPQALAQVLEWGFRATPLTVIGEQKIAGFDRARLLAALGEP